MKKVFAFASVLILFATISHAQEQASTSRTEVVGEKVAEFEERFDFSTPLDGYLSLAFLKAMGRQSVYRSASSTRVRHLLPKTTTSDVWVSDEDKRKLLSVTIEEVIVYKDSLAGVITSDMEGAFAINFLSYEGG